jgi:hypothetical protein
MSIVYKIRHNESGKFIRIRLTKEGVRVWKDLSVIEGKFGFGKVLYDTHVGWKTSPELTEEELLGIGCSIVKYEIKETEL